MRAIRLIAAIVLGFVDISLSAQTLAPSRIKIYGWVEAGFTGNPEAPRDRQNFGRLFDDRSNEPVANQLALTIERALEAKNGFDWGFKLQGLFGTDARYIHSLGLFDREMSSSLYQPDISEAYLSLHLPVLSAGGVDVKLGNFVTLEGIETIDPRTNAFYSHTYIFNFGIPINHTGALFTVHANSWLDVIVGGTRGVNTSVEDNNDAPAFHGGLSLNLCEGKLLIAGSTHVGPETPRNNRDLRYLNDLALTWKISEKLTALTDLNFTRDRAVDADAYGVAQYFIYAPNSWLAFKVRGEIWRDDSGFFVAQYAGPSDPLRALAGDAVMDPRTIGTTGTTYGAFTIGLDLKPPVPKPFAALVIRPEVRVDHSLSGSRPFNDSSDATMFTAALDVILSF